MTKLKRKFLSEFGISLCNTRWLLIPASQITSDGVMDELGSEISKKCHIYLICERPSIYFDENDFLYDGKNISGSIVYKMEGKEYREKFNQEFELFDGATDLKLSKYPHRQIETFDKLGNRIRHLPANAISIAHQTSSINHPFSKLKVLYVGQAFGNGSRTALDRLRSHSTLQKILAEAGENSPDNEIFVVTVEYPDYRLILNIDGTSKNAISGKRDSKRFISINENPLKASEQISLVEAALIRYFQPHYNKIYKKKFPSRDLKVLQSCYKYDYSALFVEINTEELNQSLYSETIRPSLHHTINIDLVDDQNRLSFFHLPGHDGTPYKSMPTISSANNVND